MTCTCTCTCTGKNDLSPSLPKEYNTYFFLTPYLCQGVDYIIATDPLENIQIRDNNIKNLTFSELLNRQMFMVTKNHTTIYNWLVSEKFACFSDVDVTHCEGNLINPFPSYFESSINDFTMPMYEKIILFFLASFPLILALIGWVYILYHLFSMLRWICKKLL